MATQSQLNAAEKVVAGYTLAAAATGAIPVPAASAAIVAENAAMITHVGGTMGTKVSVETVIEALGVMGTVNMVGRTLFIEGAKILSWGTGSPWAAVLLSGLGASTAGLQTYIVGMLAIEIAKNGGMVLPSGTAKKVIAHAKHSYDSFVAEWGQRRAELSRN